MGEKNNKRRGRPEGFHVSDKTKEKIRKYRLGTPHSEKTKNKISQSLSKHFKERYPLSVTLEEEYENYSEEVLDWMSDNKENIDEMEHVVRDNKLTRLRQVEICCGSNIDGFGHNATPEFILLLRDELIENGQIEEAIELASLI